MALKTLLSFIAILSGSVAVTRVFDIWIGQEERERLRRYLQNLSSRIEETPPFSLMHTPFRLGTSACDALFGPAVLSQQALRRAALLHVLLLLFSLGVAGWATGAPFGLPHAPWSFSTRMLEELKGLQSTELTPEEREFNLKWSRMVEGVTSPPWNWAYAISIVAVTFLVTGMAGAVSLALTRLLMRELILSDSPTLTVAAIVFNLFIAGSVSTGLLVVIAIFSQPAVWLLLPLVPLLLTGPAVLTGPLVAFVTAGLWGYGSTWTRIVALTSILPAFGLILLGVVIVGLYPFRTQIHAATNGLIGLLGVDPILRQFSGSDKLVPCGSECMSS